MKTDAWFDAQFAEIRPKAIGFLNRQFRDIELAEEAFSVSCMRAIKNWPEKGMPDNPLAWLLTVGRNAGRDIIRKRSKTALNTEIQSIDTPEENYIHNLDSNGLRDDVLRLLFICCHPSLSPQDQSAVALRIVAGLTVEEIAKAFLIKPKTMEQRLTRAKRTIQAANIPFAIPDLMERNRRLKSVMLMLYLLFNEGWSASSGNTQIKIPLCNEALRLSRLLLNLFSGVSELMGLHALFLFQHSRRQARLSADDQLVPLENQDRSLWDYEKIAEANILLEKALRHAAPGPYQIQAAISAVHVRADTSAQTDWEEIVRLYAALYLLEPTPVIKLNHASAIAKIKGPQAALEILEPLKLDLDSYRWYHAALAAFYSELEEYQSARDAYKQVLSLDPTRQERAFVLQKMYECKNK